MRNASQDWGTAYDLLLKRMSPFARDFSENCEHFRAVQYKILTSILRDNHTTPLGLKYGFSSVSSYEEYSQRVPISTYEDYQDRFTRGDPNYFTHSPLKGYTLSSGSSSARKLIPLTEHLVSEFSRALCPWLTALLLHEPRCTTGPGYWIIGPVINHDDRGDRRLCADGDYFPAEIGAALSNVLMSVPSCGGSGGFAEWALITLAHLLLEPNLSWISVWSPSLLVKLVSYIPCVRSDLISIFEMGSFAQVATAISPLAMESVLRKLSERADVRKSILQELRENLNLSTAHLWPNLHVISCWTDGWAQLFLSDLQKLFPRAVIQPKGLLATECVISIPMSLSTADAPVLSYHSHFYEFSHDESGTIYLAADVRAGERYRVLVTTGGGLYRYDLGDYVEITGFYRGVPRLRFLGKGDTVSDVCGEKLNEAHVARCFTQVAKRLECSLAGSFLQPRYSAEGYHYCLYSPVCSTQEVALVLEHLETALRENSHYEQARLLGQLGSLRHEVISEFASSVTLSTAKQPSLRPLVSAESVKAQL